jgi:cob(I)alamin adenosyltransferase
MKKSKVYTKTGDLGQTALVSGSRLLKSDLRIDLYGELDELNSRIGFSCSLLTSTNTFKDIIEFLQLIQSAIFDLGSNMACEAENRSKYKLPEITESFVKDLEIEIDRLDQNLEPLTNFILPGGSNAGSALHLCRTNTRTVERKLISYFEKTKEPLPENSIVFLNRLSDYFFVLARFVNKESKSEEISWKPRI